MKKSVVHQAMKKFLVGLSMVLSTSPALSHAKNEKGNGGGAWVCRENNGHIRWAKLVDLFEAENEFGLSISQYPGQVRDIVDQIQLRIFQANRDLYESLVPSIERVAYLESNPPRITYTEDTLVVIDDSLYRLAPAQRRCVGGKIRYEQVVNYKNDGLILVQSEIFNSLSQSERAALVLHEAVYAYRRESAGDENSMTTRRIVGLVFSTLSTAELKKALEDLDERESSGTRMEFAKVSPGEFMMGSPEHETGRGAGEKLHLVRLTRGFEIQKTEVTQAQWVEVMGSNPSYFQRPGDCPKTHQIVNGVEMCPNQPVEQVNWDDVQIFLSKLNYSRNTGYSYRLPTEAEWEYAARAGTRTAYSFGDDPAQLSKYGNYSYNSGNRPHDVGQLKPNPLGLYDMHGNVAEWVSDRWGPGSSRPATDPVGPETEGPSRVIRGGSWASLARQLRSAHRHDFWHFSKARDLGFRLVRTR